MSEEILLMSLQNNTAKFDSVVLINTNFTFFPEKPPNSGHMLGRVLLRDCFSLYYSKRS